MYFFVKYIDYQKYTDQIEYVLKPTSEMNTKPREEDFNKPRTSRVSKVIGSTMSISKPSIGSNTIPTMDTLSEFTDPVENNEVMINSDCYLGSIIDYICEVTGVPRNKNICMCTTTDPLMDMNDYPLSVTGTELFIPKETYYIIFKEYDDSGREIKKPLLHRGTDEFFFFMSRFSTTPSDLIKMISTSSMKTRAKRRSSRSKSGRKSIVKDRRSLGTILPLINQKK